MFLPILLDGLISGFDVDYVEQHTSYFCSHRFSSTRKRAIDTSELSNEDRISYLNREAIHHHLYLCLIYMVWCTLQCGVEENIVSILVFEIKKTS